jgi:hypothetical protein
MPRGSNVSVESSRHFENRAQRCALKKDPHPAPKNAAGLSLLGEEQKSARIEVA